MTPEHQQPSAPTEVEARQLLVEEWGPLSGKLELPLSVPLYCNLLSSLNPEGGDAGGTPGALSDLQSLHLSPWLTSVFLAGDGAEGEGLLLPASWNTSGLWDGQAHLLSCLSAAGS